ncbi:hypothetical protein HMSSN036_68790 [Paenibacillus macerans]|nr:hypothetical protein HMSSN036_68790 [Paenibacillus macerans]
MNEETSEKKLFYLEGIRDPRHLPRNMGNNMDGYEKGLLRFRYKYIYRYQGCYF